MSFKMLDMIIIAYSQTKGDALSGGDRIFIECAKRWAEKGRVLLITCKEGYEMCQRSELNHVKYIILPSGPQRLWLYLIYVLRMIKCCILTLTMPVNENTIIYSSSDFWPDSIPAWLLKVRFKAVRWIAGFYLFAPSPFSDESPYKGRKLLKGLIYYISQIPVYRQVKKYADIVFVTSEPDRARFVNDRLTPDKVVAVRGGVDIKIPATVPEPKEKRYDAVFIGRFHPQKGVLELIDIWKHVWKEKRDAKLAMIGVGELKKDIQEKIEKCGLEHNIDLLGFQDGYKKIRIFKSSKVVLHPAIYDSGGMAACEAMACGLPGVSFDLTALKTYYPKGMLKAPCYDLKRFAENILELLNNEELYRKTAKDALDWAREWDWDKRADELLKSILKF